MLILARKKGERGGWKGEEGKIMWIFYTGRPLENFILKVDLKP